MPRVKVALADKKWALIFNTGLFIVLCIPGIWYLGCVYAVAAQLFLVACILLGQPQIIPIAARISQLAAISNALLSILEWKAVDNVLYMMPAAVHSAVVTAFSVLTIIDSDRLHTRY